MSAVRLILKGRLGRRFGGLLTIAVLAGIGLGLSHGALELAATTDSAPARIAAAGNAVHVEWTTDLAPAEVRSIVRQGAGDELGTIRHWVGFIDIGGALGDADILGPYGGDETLERALPRLGRVPAEADEVLLNEMLAARAGVTVGDELSLVLLTADFADVVPARFVVVGIGTLPVEQGFVDDTRVTPTVLVSRAFAEEHSELVVWASHGAILPDGPASRERVSPILESFGWSTESVLVEKIQTAREAARPTVVSLRVLGALGLVATALVTAFTLVREIELWENDRTALAGIGLDRRLVRGLDHAVVFGVLLVAGVLGVLGGLALSRLGPVGALRAYDTDPAFRIDPVAVGLVAIAAVAAGVLAILLARQRSGPSPAGPVPTRDIAVALLSGSGDARRTAVLTLLLGSLAVAAASGALHYVMSLDALTGNPERYGQPWDAMARNRFGQQSPEDIAAIAADPDVSAVATISSASLLVDGLSVPVGAYDVVFGQDELVVTDGRVMVDDTEAVIGAATRTVLGLELGDAVEIRAPAALPGAGPGESRRLTLVGDALFPTLSSPGASVPRLDSGLFVTAASWESLVGPGDLPEMTLVSVADGVDVESMIARHETIRDANDGTYTEWYTSSRPAEIRSVADARRWLWGGQIALTLVVASIVAVALRALIRHQRREFAILRALGAPRRRLRGIALREGALLLAPMLVIGVPCGIGLARFLFVRLAADVGVVGSPTTPVWASAAFVGVVSTISLAGVLLAARGAAGVRPATLLRDE